MLRVFDGNEDLIRYFQFLAGYALTGSTRHELFVICHGIGGCGKSTTLELLKKVIGGDYASGVSHDVILEQRFTGHPCSIAALQGKRMLLASELPQNARWNEPNIKRIATGDTFTAREIAGKPFDFRVQATLFVNTNEIPAFMDNSGAMTDRIRLLPFTVKLRGTDGCKTDMEEELWAEREGILRWMIEGAKRTTKKAPPVPNVMRLDLERYVQENDLLAKFLEERTKKGPGELAEVGSTYDAYVDFQGVGALSKPKFGKELRRRGFDQVRHQGTRCWSGFSLTNDRNDRVV